MADDDYPREPIMNYVIKGKIILHDANGQVVTLSSLPAPSYLKVGVQDIALCDAPAVPCGATEDMEVSQTYSPSKPMTFEVHARTTADTGLMPDSYALSGTLNVGWKPGDKEDDSCLRIGDYLTDTNWTVPLEPGKTEYHMDLILIHYTE